MDSIIVEYKKLLQLTGSVSEKFEYQNSYGLVLTSGELSHFMCQQFS